MKKIAGDIIILYMCTKNHNHMMYGSWDMECDRHNFLSLWTVFCPMDPENQNFEKMKETLEDIIILQISHKWQSYDIWFFRHGVQQTKCFDNLDRFLPFYPPPLPLTTWKIKILKKWKKALELPSFYTSVSKIMIICYTVP